MPCDHSHISDGLLELGVCLRQTWHGALWCEQQICLAYSKVIQRWERNVNAAVAAMAFLIAATQYLVEPQCIYMAVFVLLWSITCKGKRALWFRNSILTNMIQGPTCSIKVIEVNTDLQWHAHFQYICVFFNFRKTIFQIFTFLMKVKMSNPLSSKMV